MVSFLEKNQSEGFEQIVDILNAHTLRVYGKEIIITESFVRRDLQLADEEGVDCLPNSTIFENLELMGEAFLKDSNGEDVDVHTYRSMIGSLMYITSSRQDIMFAKQTVVATSSTEAEYVAASSGCAQVLRIQNQLLDYRNMVIKIVVLNILSDALPITTNGVQFTMSNPQERVDST
nr:hypothetical protein [Tanacetum cinerariifolium]